MTIEAHAVHIENLQKQIKELSKDCESQHKDSLEAIKRIHDRIDNFTSFLMQMSELNKDVQASTAHIKTLEVESRELERRMSLIERQTESNTETAKGIKKLGWAIVTGFGGLIGVTLWQLILAVPK